MLEPGCAVVQRNDSPPIVVFENSITKHTEPDCKVPTIMKATP